MIEPQSAQDGASAWALKVTWALPMPSAPSAARMPFPLVLPLPLPLLLPEAGEAEERGASPGRSLAGVEVAVAVGGVPLEAGEEAAGEEAPVSDEPALSPLSGEAGPAAGESALPEVPAPPAPPVPLRPRVSGCTEDSAAADRSTNPSVARSSGGRNREPSQRKM